MTPGGAARPSASMTRRAGPSRRPSSTILPSATATSPWKAGRPEPSMMRPFLISRSYAMALAPFRFARSLRRDPIVARAVVPEDLLLALLGNGQLHERVDRVGILRISVRPVGGEDDGVVTHVVDDLLD